MNTAASGYTQHANESGEPVCGELVTSVENQ
jgi:hypothetical protein